jgi:hypothetical protein
MPQGPIHFSQFLILVVAEMDASLPYVVLVKATENVIGSLELVQAWMHDALAETDSEDGLHAHASLLVIYRSALTFTRALKLS